MSKETLVTARTVSSGPQPTVASMPVKKLTALRCRIAVPLGLPVEPEV